MIVATENKWDSQSEAIHGRDWIKLKILAHVGYNQRPSDNTEEAFMEEVVPSRIRHIIVREGWGKKVRQALKCWKYLYEVIKCG